MADNAAQAIKDLQKNIESLDVSLDKALKSQEKYTQMIAKTFQDAANQGKVSIDELVSYIGKQTNKMSNAMKIKWQIDLGTGKMGVLEQQMESINKDIAKYTKANDTQAVELLKKQLKELKDEYKQLEAVSKKSAAQMYDDMLKIVNAAAGTQKDSKGTALGQARAAVIKENLKTIKKIDELTTQIAEKQEKLGKYREGSRTWEKTRKEIEDANKQLQQYQDKLNRLQGHKVVDASAKALKTQEQNFLKLNRLLNERKTLEAQIKAQGGIASSTQTRYQNYINKAIKDTVASMRELGKQYQGITELASKNTMESRMRRTKQTVDNLNRSIRGTKTEIEGMVPLLQRLGSALGVAFSLRSLAQFGRKLIEVRGEFEMQFVAMKQIIGDVDAATKIWNQTLQQALQSPKTFKELVTYTKQLAAYRIETDKLFDTTKRLADVSAGLGVDMGRLILAYGQVKTANYLRASEVRQFTEAGVNIYGELAKYFSEIEGRAIGTAEVVERVTKRMVLFSDVENIFKRMTDEGGDFFNMQEVQADTVKGQIMKLRDAYDQMLNTIGEQNQGTIRGLVEALNELVRNWRDVASFIMKNVNALVILLPLMVSYRKGAAIAAGETWTWSRAMKQIELDLAFARKGMEKFSLSTAMGTAAVNLFRGAVVLAKTALKTFLPVLAIESIVWFITKLGHASREMKAFREELEKVSTENIDSMSREIDGYGVLLEKIKETNEGTLARKELMDEMSSKYGKYLDFVVNEKTSVEELSDAYGKVAQSIRNYTAEKIRGEQEQRIGTAMHGEYQNMIKALTGATITDMEGLNSYGKLTKQQAQNIAKLIRESLEKYGSADVSQIIKTYLGDTYGKGKNVRGGVAHDLQAFVDNWKALNEELKSITSEFAMPIFGTEAEYREYQSRVDQLKEFNKSLDDSYKERIQSIKEQTDLEEWQAKEKINALEKQRKLRLLDKQIELELITQDQYRNELKKLNGDLSAYEADYNERLTAAFNKRFGADWKERNQDALKMYRAVESTESALQQGTIQRNKQLKESYDGLKDSLKDYKAQLAAAEKTGAAPDVIEGIEGDIKWAQQNIEAIELAAKLRGIDLTETKHTGGQQKESVSKMLSLLREMNSEYEKLSKSAYGYAKAEELVRESFERSFKAIFKVKDGAGQYIDMENTKFDTKQDLANALQALYNGIKEKGGFAKFAKGTEEELLKAIDSARVEADIDVQVRNREDFARQMEDAFNDYDITLELQNLGISGDMAKGLFPDLDYTSIGKLQRIMKDFYDSRQKEDEKENVLFSVKDLEEYRKWADKIDAEILKARKEKVKQYSKYLEKEYSERAKLEMQHAQDVAFVTANITDVAQRNNIIENINRKYQNDLNDLNWRSFKESDFYVEMMDDISSLPKEYMQMMLDKIEEILKNPDTLSPRTLKEAINARQKVLEAQMNLEPLDVMRSSLSTINKAKNEVGGVSWKDTKEKINQQIEATQEEINQLEEEARCWDEVAAKMQVYEDAALAVSEAKGKLSTETRSLVDEQGSENVVADYQQKINANNVKIQELEAKGEGNLAPDEQDQLNALRETNGYYERQIALIQQLIALEEQLGSIRQMQAGTDAEAQRGEGGVGTAAAARGRAQESRDEAKTPKQKIQNLKQYLKAFTNFDAAFAKFNAAINSTLNAVAGMGDAFYDMFDALGGKTDALTEGWKEFGNTMISSITNALTMIPMMVAAFTAAGIAINSAMGIIGLIAEALNLLMTAITAISKLHDARYEKEIENQQKKIDDLKAAYERLEKAIEKTWTSMAYIDTYNQQVENIKQQIEAIKAQRNAENSKKNTDKDKIKEYGDAIQEAYDELEELEQKRIEVFGGLGESAYKGEAQNFVDAWKEAFLETGDGLQGLQDHFDEFLNEWFVKQATMRVAGRILEPLFKQIDNAVDESSQGGANVLLSELQRVRENFATIAPQLSDALEQLAGMWGLGDTEGGLSGLAAGIQGMSEEQANILEAYWNSVRMYTASIDMNVSRIAEILGAGVGDRANPQLQQLELIARNTSAIQSLFGSVVEGGHTRGGRGVRVFVD